METALAAQVSAKGNAAGATFADPPVRPVSAYVAIGPTLVNFEVDAESGLLTRRGEIVMPSRVQYAWPHATLPILYVACADRAPDAEGQPFYLCAMVRDAVGDLGFLGKPVVLPSRPIHVTTDIASRHVLTAYSAAPGLTVHELGPDGSIEAELPRSQPFDYGASPHQVRVTPLTNRAILVARGKKGFGGAGYIEGALKVLRFDRGRVENVQSIVPADAAAMGGFNPRHLDFHPTRPWVFVSLEAQNKLCVFRIDGADLGSDPLFTRDALARPDDVQPRQDGGTVHVHPNGKYVYMANRNDGYVGGHLGPSWLTPEPIPVFPGGENNIAVFEIDEDTGEPALVQTVDSHGLHPRTFALDPSAQILIAGNLAPTRMQEGDSVTDVPANLAVFRVGEDGRLSFRRRYELDLAGEMVWWMGVVG
jgi:6-phosphogluconolactonase (cycloisomerase 2 family)